MHRTRRTYRGLEEQRQERGQRPGASSIWQASIPCSSYHSPSSPLLTCRLSWPAWLAPTLQSPQLPVCCRASHVTSIRVELCCVGAHSRSRLGSSTYSSSETSCSSYISASSAHTYTHSCIPNATLSHTANTQTRARTHTHTHTRTYQSWETFSDSGRTTSTVWWFALPGVVTIPLVYQVVPNGILYHFGIPFGIPNNTGIPFWYTKWYTK